MWERIGENEMKKIIRVLLVVMLVMSMVTPAFATDGFTGSIDVTPSPELANLGTIPAGYPNAGEDCYGIIRDANGDITLYLTAAEVIVTPIERINAATHLTNAEKALFHSVLNDLKTDDAILPEIEGLTESVKAALGSWAEVHHMEIAQYFDIKIVKKGTAEKHQQAYDYLENGGTLSVRLNFAISTEKHIEVMSHALEAADYEWQLAVAVSNNGTSIDVVFNHLCPVAILVEIDNAGPGPQDPVGPQDPAQPGQPGDGPSTGDDRNPLLWGGICLAAAAGVVFLVVASKRKEEEQQ